MLINSVQISHADQFFTFVQLFQPLWVFLIKKQIDVHFHQFVDERTVFLTSDEVIFHIGELDDRLLHFILSDQEVHLLFHAAELVIVETDALATAIIFIVITNGVIKPVSHIDVSVWTDIGQHRLERLDKSDSVVDEDSTMVFHQEVRDQSPSHIVCFVDQLIEHFCRFFFVESVFESSDDFCDLQGAFFGEVLGVIFVGDVIDDEVVLLSDLDVVETVELVQLFEWKRERFVRQLFIWLNIKEPSLFWN